MGKPTGFLEVSRRDRDYQPPQERLRNYREFVNPLPTQELVAQASRCMDCGIPFCHNGCPVNNQIPDFNNLVYREQWKAALDNLLSTNNFPEFTGRICPAPCEASCTLNIQDTPVTIKTIECQIIDRGWEEGWITPHMAPRGTGKRVAVVGSGPAGLACAQQLARAGHAVTVFEKSDRIGGLLRYGIPDFKMEKHLIDRRVAQMEAEGVIFRTSFEVGVNVSVQRLMDDYEVLVMAGGAEAPRDLEIEGRELGGIHFAMDFLTQQNKRGAHRRHLGHRKACGGDRWRRHRIGLHRHLQPPRSRVGDPAGDHAPAARAREQGPHLAGLAPAPAHFFQSPGRL